MKQNGKNITDVVAEHQVARRPEEQHPWMRILYASGGVVRWLKLFRTAGNVE